MLSPKNPTTEELRNIAQVVAESKEEVEQIFEQLKDAAVAKFAGYTSDGPGYHGDVFVVVWPGGPEVVDVLTRNGTGELVANAVETQAPITNVWGEDDQYPRADWRYEVECGYTNLGYWDWVRGRRANESSG